MNKKSKVENEKCIDTNETHLFAGIISFFFPAWGELFRGHYKNWLLYSFIGLPLVILVMVMFAATGIGIPIAGIILLLYQIKCARMSYNDKGLTDGLSGFFTKRNILIIILVVIIGIFALRTIGLMYNEQQKAHLNDVKNNISNNSTGVNTTVEKISTDDNNNNQKESSSSDNVYKSGLTDAEIEANIQRDIAVREANGVKTEYDMEQARSFYENVPKEGMR